MIVKEKYYEIVDEVLANDFKGKIAVDATLGKGNDTEKLLKTVGENGKVYAFDIQDDAIDFCQEKFKDVNNLEIFKTSHEYIDILESYDLVIYNLGYLPGSDKKIRTNAMSTVISLSKATKDINPCGILIIVSYMGHEGSEEERTGVERFLKSLDQKLFKVEKREFFNEINNPPIVYLVEKKLWKLP